MIRSIAKTFAVACLLVVFISQIGHAQTILPEKWTSSHFSKNILVGKVFKGDGKPSSPSALILASWFYRYVLIGEQHDNPDHHIIQANLIEQAAANGRKPAVVLEMVPRSYASQIAKYDLAKDPQMDDFAKRLDWEKRGWYSFEIYRPVVLAAAKASLSLIAGNLDRDVTRTLSKQGLETLTAEQQKRFGLDASYPDEDRQSLLNELKDSHCGMMPASALPSMVNVQRAVDGSLADAMVQAGSEHGAILIAGNGHVRKDRGVPFVLRHLLPGSTQRKLNEQITVNVPNANSVSIGLIEVSESGRDFGDYELINENGKPLYDFVVFTPKFDVTDHCAALREKMSGKKKTQ